MTEKRKTEIKTSLLKQHQYTAFLQEVVDKTFRWSQIYVPVDTGHLKSTAHIRGSGGSYVICYPASYATAVHEIMHYHHTMPTQAKFLTDGFMMTMLMMVRTHGKENIPEFKVKLEMDTELGLRFFVASPQEQDASYYPWRRFVGL
jgi:hypothetical protein